ncbi:MAG TPA: ABC transporter ATP-binding protein [Candidatus Polarisedimenticolaceae bacterium]
MFKVEGLAKRYGDVRAVDGITFDVRRGEVYGLLGPNGAGKSTTMAMLSGLLRPDEGRILFDGIDLAAEPVKVKARLGIVPQEPALYETLSARENLKFWAGIYGLSGAALDKAVDRVLDETALAARGKEPVKTFSGGMKRRLNLGIGLVHAPQAVLMDEPTVGIDPQARANLLEVVRRVAEAGTTIVYTTHYLEEAESLCDRIGILDHGKILAEGTLAELKQRLGDREVVLVHGRFDAEAARAALSGVAGAQVLSADEGKLLLSVAGGGRAAVELLQRVLGGGFEVDGVEIRPPSLNALFLDLTGRELRD